MFDNGLNRCNRLKITIILITERSVCFGRWFSLENRSIAGKLLQNFDIFSYFYTPMTTNLQPIKEF